MALLVLFFMSGIFTSMYSVSAASSPPPPASSGSSASAPPATGCTSAWSTWSPCSCGANPFQQRSRSVTSTTVTCNDILSQTQPCTKPGSNCKPINCIVGPWQPWGACTAPCGSTAGKKTQYRAIITPAMNGGTCPAQNDLSNSVACTIPTALACTSDDATSWSWLLSPAFIVGASLALWTGVSLLMGWLCYRTHLKELESLEELNE